MRMADKFATAASAVVTAVRQAAAERQAETDRAGEGTPR